MMQPTSVGVSMIHQWGYAVMLSLAVRKAGAAVLSCCRIV
jgi:hypothetical protein